MSGAIPKQLSRSQFNRRLHRPKPQFVILFEILGQAYKQHNQDAKYLIDTFPIPACVFAQVFFTHLDTLDEIYPALMVGIDLVDRVLDGVFSSHMAC